jgi:hypothetical protein
MGIEVGSVVTPRFRLLLGYRALADRHRRGPGGVLACEGRRRLGPPPHGVAKRVTSSGWVVKGLAHSDCVPVIGEASVTTTNGVPG